MNLELRQLRYFLTVAEELHFGRAAARLHMTQPPLSQAIAALEETLGAPLFLRNRRQVALTGAGSALLPEARRLLEGAAGLPELVRRAAAGESGRLALSFVTPADYSVLPGLLRDYSAAYPNVQLLLQEATTDLQVDDLLHERIDAGLLIPPLSEKAQVQLDYMKVLEEPLVLCAPEGSLPAGDQPVDLKTLRQLPLIIFPRKSAPALYDAILSCFHEAGLSPEVKQEAIQMQTIVSLVSAGMGLALVPQSVSNLMRPGVEYRALAGPAPAPVVELGLAWRRDNASPVLRSFLELLRK